MSGILSLFTGLTDTQSVTSGSTGVTPNHQRGFISGSIGSCVDGTSDLYSDAVIQEIYWDENGGGGADFVEFAVAGTKGNGGWSTMIVDSISFSRASASFATGGGTTSWTWVNTGYTPATNPFGANLSVHTVKFS